LFREVTDATAEPRPDGGTTLEGSVSTWYLRPCHAAPGAHDQASTIVCKVVTEQGAAAAVAASVLASPWAPRAGNSAKERATSSSSPWHSTHKRSFLCRKPHLRWCAFSLARPSANPSVPPVRIVPP